MPFNPFKRKNEEAIPEATPAAVEPQPRRVRFEGLSDEWLLVGYMEIDGRLSDALNRREPIPLADMTWASLSDGGPLEPAPGLKEVDPYDLILVLAGESSLPPLSESERAALRVHKLTYDVELQVPPYVVAGRVHLFPGTDPSVLLERQSEMFVPVTSAIATRNGERLDDPEVEVILVNRFYLRGVEQQVPSAGPEA